MPFSNPLFREDIVEFIIEKFPDSNTTILDVGPGIGTYADLLPYYENIDACEIFKKYIRRYKLQSKYRKVFCQDIQSFEFDYYDLVIMGDVLEHIESEKAVILVNRILERCQEIIVKVPFSRRNRKTRAYMGNEYEIHKQTDLRPEVMEERYPMLQPLFMMDKPSKEGWAGVYIRMEGLV